MLTCKTCEVEKDDSEMVVRRGVPIRLCRVCLGKSVSGARGGGSAKKKQTSARKAKAQTAAALSIEVPGGGHGFKAVLTEEGALMITQANADAADDNIVLTKHEARALFQSFSDWADEAA